MGVGAPGSVLAVFVLSAPGATVGRTADSAVAVVSAGATDLAEATGSASGDAGDADDAGEAGEGPVPSEPLDSLLSEQPSKAAVQSETIAMTGV